MKLLSLIVESICAGTATTSYFTLNSCEGLTKELVDEYKRELEPHPYALWWDESEPTKVVIICGSFGKGL